VGSPGASAPWPLRLAAGDMSKRKAPEPTGGKAAGKRRADAAEPELDMAADMDEMENLMGGAGDAGDLTDVVDHADELAAAVGGVQGDEDGVETDDLLRAALGEQDDDGAAEPDESEGEPAVEVSYEVGELPDGLDETVLQQDEVDLSAYELTLPEARRVAQCLAASGACTSIKFSSGCELQLGDMKEEGELEWDSEEYTDVEAIVIAECLKSNTTVARLDLARNQIADAGAVALATMLSENNTIEYLNLESNTLGEPGGAAFHSALETNTSVQYLNLMYTSVPTSTQESIRGVWQRSNRGVGLHL